MNKLNDLATGIQSSFFATSETVEDAFRYAYATIDALPSESKAGAYTALHVVVNTIAEEIKRLTVLGEV